MGFSGGIEIGLKWVNDQFSQHIKTNQFVFDANWFLCAGDMGR